MKKNIYLMYAIALLQGMVFYGPIATIYRQAQGVSVFQITLIAVAFLSETHQTITVFLNQVQYERCGLSASMIGYVYMIVTLIGLGGIYSAWFTKRTGTKAAGVLLYGVAAASSIVLAFTTKTMILIGGITILRISNSLFQPFQIELQNKQICTDNRATALSINAMILDSIGAGTNLAFGALAEISLNISFLFGAGLCIIGLFLFLTWYSNWFVEAGTISFSKHLKE